MARVGADGSGDLVDGDRQYERLLDPGGKYAWVDLRGRPVDNSKTGSWRAAFLIYGIQASSFQAVILVTITLVPYLTTNMHQPISKAATITSNFSGTSFILSILGGFLADSYLGCFWTSVGGAVAISVGLGILTISTAYSRFQPPMCISGPDTQCTPAGTQYMAPLYLALYVIALGYGLISPTLVALGGNQFDRSSPKEKKQSVHFFAWMFFFTNVGAIIAGCVGVYLGNYVSWSWEFGFALMLLAAFSLIFILGASIFRHKSPAGSFLTRTAQVFVAALLKRDAAIPEVDDEIYDPALPASLSQKLHQTKHLRFLNRAAAISEFEADKDAPFNEKKPLNPWRLCSITQVEETKRILQMIPVCACTFAVNIIYAQFTTFTIQQGQTFDRKLGPHLEIPAPSLGVIQVLFTLSMIPFYDWVLFPFVRRFTKHPFGFKPLHRLGASIVLAVLTMITAALVERKRQTYVYELHFESFPLGSYGLPLKMWWLIPQYFLASQVETFLIVPSVELFYFEASEATRSIASSFTNTSLAMGSYLSAVLVQLVNRITRHYQGGSWLNENLNSGGLEKFYWFLAVLLAVDFLIFLLCAHWYEYKYDWYQKGAASQEENDTQQ